MSAVTFETRGAVAYIRLSRPDALNAFNQEMFDELAAARDRFRDDPDLKVAIITGEGKRAFSAGVDLKSYSGGFGPEGSRNAPHPFQVEMAAGTDFSEKPLIAAIRGYCLGEGMHLALACDFRVCASDAIFALPEVALGMPQTWLSWQSVRTMGLPAALDFVLLAEKKDAAWALAHQLVHQVTLPGEELAAAEKIAERLCSMSFPALVLARRTLYRAFDQSYREMLDYALPLRAQVLATGESRTRASEVLGKNSSRQP